METKADNQNMLDNSIGHIITVLFFECKNCHHIFSRLVPGIVRRVLGKLVVSEREKHDKQFKVGKCEICSSKDIYHIEFL